MTIQELTKLIYNTPIDEKLVIEIDKEFSESPKYLDFMRLWGENKDNSYTIYGCDIIFKII